MAVGAGQFQLYSKIDPTLEAGDYAFVVDQSLSGADESTRIETLRTHVRVRAPRYQLPPDQVLSTFPPAGSEGAYGSRLPQIVIKRRTLPWERDLDDQPSSTPWLALVLIAEGEATLHLNQPVADCITPGRSLPGIADTQLGSYLAVRQSVVNRIFPTRKDVPLLAHAREVDINDTELMMGDDDGYLSVVIANRLPLAGRDADGGEQPVKYLACLVNLEGQFDRLLPESPPRGVTTTIPVVTATQVLTTAEFDKARMDAAPIGTGIVQSLATSDAATVDAMRVATSGTPPYTAPTTWSLEQAEETSSNVYAAMAAEFAIDTGILVDAFDQTLRFPVLLHWSFVSSGTATFERLMRDLDSGLIGTVPPARRRPEGREPVEAVETGHVGLAHRTRRGDVVRSWYRGPAVPHPNHDASADRLPLAHVSDQLRIVIPDGREDLSLASAFEIGRLLALSRPSVVAALMQWRQGRYHVQRRRSIWSDKAGFLRDLAGALEVDAVDADIGVVLGRALAQRVAAEPESVIGGPRPLVDPGRPLELDVEVAEVMATGFGLGAVDFSADPAIVLRTIKDIDRLPGVGVDLDLSTTTIRDTLHRATDLQLVDLVANTLDLQIDGGIDPVIVGPTVPGTVLGSGVVIDDLLGGGVIVGPSDVGGVGGVGDVDGIAPLADRIRARRATIEEDDR